MRYTSILGSVLPALAIALPAAAQQTVFIDFHQYASDTTTSYQAAIGRPVTAGGFVFYNTDAFSGIPANNALGTWGRHDAGALNLPLNLGSSTALWGTTLGSQIDMFDARSDPVFGTNYVPFSLSSMEVSHLYSSAYSPITIKPFYLTFFGLTLTNTFSQTFFIPAPPVINGVQTPILQTLNFDSDFQNVDQVAWRQGPGSGTAHQFTDIIATTTPEPSSMALLGTGLTGLFGLARRRRRTKASADV